MPTVSRTSCIAALFGALLGLLGGGTGAAARTLPVVGGGEHTWVVRGEREAATTTALHRAGDAPPGVLHQAGQFRGRLLSGGLAADDEQAWLIYQDHTVQSLTAVWSEGPTGQWRFEQSVVNRLPQGELRDCVGARGRLWALLAISDASVLADLETASPDVPRPATQTRPATTAAGTQPGSPAGGSPDQAATRPAQARPPSQAQAPSELAQPVDRLLVLDRGQWRSVPLPANWPTGRGADAAAGESGAGEDGAAGAGASGGEVWLLSPADASAGRPRLLVRPRQGGPLHLYRWTGEQWRGQTYDVAARGPLAAALVQQQVVIARRRSEQPPLSVEFALLREGRVHSLGRLEIPGTEPGARWNLAAGELAVTLYADRPATGAGDAAPGAATQPGADDDDDDGGGGIDWSILPTDQRPPREGPVPVAYATLSLQGRVLQQPTQMKVLPPATPSRLATYIMVGTLVLAMVLMLSFWRRDAMTASLELPAGVNLAGFGPRALAGGVDLLPALVLAMAAYNLGPQTLLLEHWPGQPGAETWLATVPGFLAIALIVAHTTLAELIWGRSLGKALTGLRVAGINRDKPRPWQILVRGILKTLDLIVWLLLLLAIISPHRQRLGDLVARTLIVADEEPEDGEDQHRDEDEQEQEK